MITTLVAAAAWSAACYKNLPRALFGVTMEWSHGAGVLCLVFGTLVKVPDALGNLLIRTPEKRWKEQVGPIADLADYLDLEEAASPAMKDAVDDIEPPAQQEMQGELQPEAAKDADMDIEQSAEESPPPAPEAWMKSVSGETLATSEAI